MLPAYLSKGYTGLTPPQGARKALACLKVSVAMCTYNGSRHLAQQLASIAAQTLPPAELIICDDGSTDDSAAIVAAFSDSCPFPVRFSRNSTNLGSTRNFERAISLCHGDAIALCDQDDIWLPTKLQTLTAILDLEPEVSGVFSNASLIDDSGEPVAGDLWTRSGFTGAHRHKYAVAPSQALIDRDTVTGAALLFRSRFVSQILPISSDWVHDGWIALVLSTVGELRPVAECTMSYRLHSAQQVGLQQVAWHQHLGTKKEAALAAHAQVARRFHAMADRLIELQAQPEVIAAAHSRAEFLDRRVEVLRLNRGRRLLPALRLLPRLLEPRKRSAGLAPRSGTRLIARKQLFIENAQREIVAWCGV